MTRASYIINAPTTLGSGVDTETHDHNATYYTQSQADIKFIDAIGDTLTGPLDWDMVNATDVILKSELPGDTFSRITITADGTISFGSGTSAPDASIVHSGADEITAQSSLIVEGSLTVLGAVNVGGSGLDADSVDGYSGADLLNRANHTGTQSVSTLSDFYSTLDTALEDTPIFFDHGTNANLARPVTTRPVVWRGTVSPINMIDGDDFIDRSGMYILDGGTP